jgi:transcriptional regulator GlxA family with amidase domain
VRRAISYVEENVTEPVTLCELERVTKCSAFQIIRAFRSEVGTTPHAYIMSFRVKQATGLLEAGQHIIEAAADTGFADQSHFTKHFKRVHGVTPGIYRRRFDLQ